MSEHAKPNLSQNRGTLLPDLIISIVGPLLIYRLAAPYMLAVSALLLAGLLPLIRVGVNLLSRHRLNLIGALSLLAIVVKTLIALALKDVRLILVSDSLITAVYGVLMLASLLSARPLLMRLIESVLNNAPSAQSQRLMQRWQEPSVRSFFTIITAVWGIVFLLECGARIILAFILPIEQFLVISPIVRYGFLGALLLWTFLFARIRRSRQQKESERLSKPGEHETTHTMVQQ